MAFLQYRRMQLKALSVSAVDEKSGAASSLDHEMLEISRLQADLEKLKAELESKKALLNEKEKTYFADGKALAVAFLDVAKHVSTLGKVNKSKQKKQKTKF